jgi:hypothetical protein
LGCDLNPKSFRVSEEDWGHGTRLEDVWMDSSDRYENWEPHVQAFQHDDGSKSLRFCYYKREPNGDRGIFVNSAMFVYDDTLEDLRREAERCGAHEILALFRILTE